MKRRLRKNLKSTSWGPPASSQCRYLDALNKDSEHSERNAESDSQRTPQLDFKHALELAQDLRARNSCAGFIALRHSRLLVDHYRNLFLSELELLARVLYRLPDRESNLGGRCHLVITIEFCDLLVVGA